MPTPSPKLQEIINLAAAKPENYANGEWYSYQDKLWCPIGEHALKEYSVREADSFRYNDKEYTDPLVLAAYILGCSISEVNAVIMWFDNGIFGEGVDQHVNFLKERGYIVPQFSRVMQSDTGDWT